MKIKYIADDGTEFDNEFDCEEYERKQEINSLAQPYMWDEDEKPTDNLDFVTYVKISNQSQAKAFYLRCEYQGLIIPDDLFVINEDDTKTFTTGSWYYDTMDDKWVNIAKRIETLKEEMSKLAKYL